MSTTKWDHCKEIINTALGLGFPLHENDHILLTKVYKEIDGDFGTPTTSDLADFKKLIAALPGKTEAQSCAKAISILTLNLYETFI